MKKVLVKIVAVILIFCLCACSSNNTDTTPDNNTTEQKSSVLYGLGEPFESNVKRFDIDITGKLIKALGAKSYRMWFSATNTFTGWTWDKVMSDESLSSLTKNTKLMYNAQIDKLLDSGVEEITGMGQFLPRVDSTKGAAGNFFPKRTAPDYQQFLDKVKIIWRTMAQSFPKITIWEVGNELNHMSFKWGEEKTPTTKWGDHTPTYVELAELNADFMYYAYEGVKEGNPDAIVITPGIAPTPDYWYQPGDTKKTTNGLGIYSVEVFLKLIYDNIKSGEFPFGRTPCTDPDKYFDGVAYHPYDLGAESNTNAPDDEETFDIRLWVDANNSIYELMCENGDADKEVWLTEFGLTTKLHQLTVTDSSDKDIKIYYVDNKYYKTTDEFEEQQSYFIEKYFDAMESEEMSYVRSCHFFRLYGCTVDYSWNGFTVLYYGMFFEPSEALGRGFYPRNKAYKIQELYGGEGDLMEFARYSDL